ncbi:MAG: alpha-mannosidase, partial [Burkholderiales bacterium]|nr:alpha-mannosidase [Opitutaceae bacterium]
MSRHFHLVGITHIDLAWKRGFAEMAELLEMSVVWLLDALERYPDFKYTLEQVAHYRALAPRRPDLVARLAPHFRSGRLEFAGGLASTLELNLPHAECLVRNQSLGLRWLRDTWGIAPATAYTVDTFGHPAQLPQVFRQFGFTHLLTSRGGGELPEDLFHARGLDGSTVLVACWHTYGAYVKPQNIAEIFYADWSTVDPLLDKAAALRGPGPYLVIPYTENEAPISRRAFDLAAARAHSHPDETWHVSTPADFFHALDASPRPLPTVSADLNPEFTGCFSNRIALRLRNRAIETLLLDAECAGASAATLDAAWWDLAHVQFHDVLTGSHPTPVYHEAMALLDRAEAAAHASLGCSPSAPLHVFNALPWPRREWLSLPNGYSLPFDLPACGSVPFTPQSSAILENEF